MTVLERVKEKVLDNKQRMTDIRAQLKVAYDKLISSNESVFERQDEAKAAADCIESIDAYINAGDVMVATIEAGISQFETED